MIKIKKLAFWLCIFAFTALAVARGFAAQRQADMALQNARFDIGQVGSMIICPAKPKFLKVGPQLWAFCGNNIMHRETWKPDHEDLTQIQAEELVLIPAYAGDAEWALSAVYGGNDEEGVCIFVMIELCPLYDRVWAPSDSPFHQFEVGDEVVISKEAHWLQPGLRATIIKQGSLTVVVEFSDGSQDELHFTLIEYP